MNRHLSICLFMILHLHTSVYSQICFINVFLSNYISFTLLSRLQSGSLNEKNRFFLRLNNSWTIERCLSERKRERDGEIIQVTHFPKDDWIEKFKNKIYVHTWTRSIPISVNRVHEVVFYHPDYGDIKQKETRTRIGPNFGIRNVTKLSQTMMIPEIKFRNEIKLKVC